MEGKGSLLGRLLVWPLLTRATVDDCRVAPQQSAHGEQEEIETPRRNLWHLASESVHIYNRIIRFNLRTVFCLLLLLILQGSSPASPSPSPLIYLFFRHSILISPRACFFLTSAAASVHRVTRQDVSKRKSVFCAFCGIFSSLCFSRGVLQPILFLFLSLVVVELCIPSNSLTGLPTSCVQVALSFGLQATWFSVASKLRCHPMILRQAILLWRQASSSSVEQGLIFVRTFVPRRNSISVQEN